MTKAYAGAAGRNPALVTCIYIHIHLVNFVSVSNEAGGIPFVKINIHLVISASISPIVINSSAFLDKFV
jgi:hypothetical protein